MLFRSKAAEPVARRLTALFSALPKPLRRTITFDNGTEFARHYRLTDRLHMATFFCEPHAPWQKGGVENAIGRMRRTLPRKTDLATMTERDLDALVAAYNDTPRKCLGFRTPAEAFSTLRICCTSTVTPPPRLRGNDGIAGNGAPVP